MSMGLAQGSRRTDRHAVLRGMCATLSAPPPSLRFPLFPFNTLLVNPSSPSLNLVKLQLCCHWREGDARCVFICPPHAAPI